MNKNDQDVLINGLILSGGKSERMGTDKSLLNYNGQPQRAHLADILQPFCTSVFISCNRDQSTTISTAKIVDEYDDIGPMGGLLSAFQCAPDRAWLIIACDMPFITNKTLSHLIKYRNPTKLATVYSRAEGKLPEPLIAIWETSAYPALLQAFNERNYSLRKVLIDADIQTIIAPDTRELQNINDREAYLIALKQLKTHS